MEPEALRRRARLSQSGAEHEQSRITMRGLDPDYIRQLEHFPRFSHEQIYSRVQAMNPGDMHTAAQVWVSIADSMFGALCTLHATVQATLADALSGHIAHAAEQAARQFVRDATDVAEIAHGTGHRMIAAAYGAEAVRKTVPPPVPDGPARTKDEQYHLALAALDANYVPIYPPAGTAVPAFFALGSPGDSASEDSSGTTGSGAAPGSPGISSQPAILDPWDGRGGTPEPAPGSPGTMAAATNPADTQHFPESGTEADLNDPAYRGSDSRTQDDQRSKSPRPADIETEPATTPPTSPLTPAPIGHPTNPLAPRPSPATPDPGQIFPGPVNPEPLTQPRQPNSPNGSGPPASAPSGMFAPGARPTADPDSRHRTPPWLIRDRQDELLGNPLPHVPPTIGAEFPAARNDLMLPSGDSRD